MPGHYVKCLYCGETFDAKADEQDIVWFKPRTNRYAHIKCSEERQEEDKITDEEFDALYRYVKEQQGKNFNFVQFQRVTSSWKKDYGYTYSGMLKSLLYFYEVKGNSKEKFREGSIGIIPFCYTQAYNYYYDIYVASQRAGTGTYNSEAKREIEIDAPAAKKEPPKLFNLGSEDEDEE